MALALDLKQLGSSLVRKAAAGEEMTRLVSGPIVKEEDNSPLSIFGKALNLINDWGAKVSGSLLKTLSSWGWSALTFVLYQVPVFVRGFWSFNWNATDQELDGYWANFVNSLAGLAGGTIGNAIGWLVCGAVPGLVTCKFNKTLGLRILKEVGEEALEELCANLWNLGRQIATGLARAGMVNLYKSTRRAIKRLVSGDSDWAKGFALLAGPAGVEAVKNWGEKGSKPWSFAKKQEDFVESFKVSWQQNFVEEALEEFQDSCEEAWYVVAATADQWIQEQRFNRESIHGELDVVEVYPDRENEEERIVLAGPQELLKPVIVNAITNYQLIENRNIGNFMGEPVEVLAQREYRTIMARIVFSSAEGKKKDVTSVTLYNVKQSKIDDWALLKQACGGANGYMWGAWLVTATMSDETFIKLWAVSEDEGIDRVKALSEFVEGEIETINSSHKIKEAKRIQYEGLQNKPRRQYPYELTIVNPVAILNEENGKTTKKGVYKDRKAILPLYTDSKPDDWSSTLQSLFYTPGPDGD